MEMRILGITLILVTVSNAVRIIGGSATVVEKGAAVLHCKAVDTSDSIEQVFWQRVTRGKPQRNNFFAITESGPSFAKEPDHRFKFVGDFSDRNGTLMLSNVSILDEGTYTCIVTLYPSGNHQIDIPLRVLVPPITSLKEHKITLGDKEVVLATCTAARSEPATNVTWVLGTLENKVRTTINTTLEEYDLKTTVSDIFGVPTREISNHSVQCVITNTVLSVKKTLNFTINVQSPPLQVNITERSANTFECQTQGYPTPVVTWFRPGKQLPPGVTAEGATLKFASPTFDLNGIYLCEASNVNGKQLGHLTFYYSPGSCSACWVLFTLLLIAITAAATAAGYFYKSGKLLWKEERTTNEMKAVRQTSLSSEEDHRVMEGDNEEE